MSNIVRCPCRAERSFRHLTTYRSGMVSDACMDLRLDGCIAVSFAYYLLYTFRVLYCIRRPTTTQVAESRTMTMCVLWKHSFP